MALPGTEGQQPLFLGVNIHDELFWSLQQTHKDRTVPPFTGGEIEVKGDGGSGHSLSGSKSPLCFCHLEPPG